MLYEGIEPGGQLTTTTDVENFPGYPDGVSGQQMMADMRRQAERFGTEIRTGTATRVDLASRPFQIPGAPLGDEIPRHGRECLRHLRRLLLP